MSSKLNPIYWIKYCFNTEESPFAFPWMMRGIPKNLRDIRVLATRQSRKMRLGHVPFPVLCTRTLCWPILSFFRAWKFSRMHNERVSAEAEIGWFEHFYHVLGCLLLQNICIADYYGNRLYSSAVRKNARYFIGDRELQAIQTLMLGDTDPEGTNNKLLFARIARQRNLPVPPTIAHFDPLHQGGPGIAPEEIPPMNFFAKPACMWGGKHGALWTYNGTVWSDGINSCDAQRLLKLFKARGQEMLWLWQPQLKNAPEWAIFSKRTLATLRVMTLAEADGSVTPLAAFLRMPTGPAHVDNLSSGGIAAELNLTTGRLGVARGLSMQNDEYERHPDTEARIYNAYVPAWETLVALACEAHKKFPKIPSLGWDIALTQRGPMIIETNILWGAPLTPLIGATRFTEFAHKHLVALGHLKG